MQHNNKVSFSVVGSMTVIPEKTSTSYRSAIIFGTARVLSDEEKRPAIELIARKYSSEYMDVAQKTIDAMWDQFCVVAINVEHLTGKAG